MERTDKLNQLKQFNRPGEYDCCDIAEKLVELSNLPDDGQLKKRADRCSILSQSCGGESL